MGVMAALAVTGELGLERGSGLAGMLGSGLLPGAGSSGS